VPGIIQAVFPCYHGVASYWSQVPAPANPTPGGRYLLRFWRGDYLADVWGNGKHVGHHEGAYEACVLDVTEAIWSGQDAPTEAGAGSINTALGYSSGLLGAVYGFGASRLTFNTLRILENLGTDSVAERLLRNMLSHAVRDANKSLVDLPGDFHQRLKALGDQRPMNNGPASGYGLAA